MTSITCEEGHFWNTSHHQKTTLNMLISVIDYLEPRKAIFIYYIIIYHQILNLLFGHYNILTTSLGR